MFEDPGTYHVREHDDYHHEKDGLASFAAEHILAALSTHPRTELTVFIATGSTAALTGEKLGIAVRRRGSTLIKMYTHSVPFASRCMELDREGKWNPDFKVLLAAGFSPPGGELDLKTGLVKHTDNMPDWLHFDYFVWGSENVSAKGVHASLDVIQLETIIKVSERIILLPISRKFRLSEGLGKPIRYWGHMGKGSKKKEQGTSELKEREKEKSEEILDAKLEEKKKHWHLVVPRPAGATSEEQRKRSAQIDVMIASAGFGTQVTLHDLRAEQKSEDRPMMQISVPVPPPPATGKPDGSSVPSAQALAATKRPVSRKKVSSKITGVTKAKKSLRRKYK